MILSKSLIRRSLSSFASSPSDSLLADKALTILRRHPYQLQALSENFSPDAASNLLLKSQNDQELILKFLNWAKPHQFFTLRCKCITLHILTRFKLYKTAQTLAEDVAAKTPDEEDASLVFRSLQETYDLCNSTSSVFDLVVKSYSRVNLIDKALSIIHLAQSHGFMPGVLSYNAVLDATIRSKRNISFAENVFKEMMESQVSPNVFTYNILIRGFCSAGNLDVALQLLQNLCFKFLWISRRISRRLRANQETIYISLESSLNQLSIATEISQIGGVLGVDRSILDRSICQVSGEIEQNWERPDRSILAKIDRSQSRLM